jgi:membrane protein DedA with SNARE-associated domain/rhodanese-related sulfurtransferase
MTHLFNLIEHYGLMAVFLNVFVEQLGAPIPAYPTLVISGALLGSAQYSALTLLASAVSAALTADVCWYFAGRRYGRKVMSMLCRISLTPDACIHQTESVYMHWGAPSLMIAKFIPGFASIASGLAGSMRTTLPVFVLFDFIGAAIWSGVAIFLGSLFHSTVNDLLNVIEELGKWGGALIVGALAFYIMVKWSQRFLLIRALKMARISVEELSELIEKGISPTIVDVRVRTHNSSDRIPGALSLSLQEIADFQPVLTGEDDEVIVYCSCPNELSAARVAKGLMNKGYKKVRPLKGGIDAWIAAGNPIESKAA